MSWWADRSCDRLARGGCRMFEFSDACGQHNGADLDDDCGHVNDSIEDLGATCRPSHRQMPQLRIRSDPSNWNDGHQHERRSSDE